MAEASTCTATVRSFFDTAFNEGKPEEAVKLYVGNRYTQPNPQAGDGPEAFIGFVNWYRASSRSCPSRSSERSRRTTSSSRTA